MQPYLSSKEFQILKGLIIEKCGILISDEKSYLIESRLSKLLIDSGFRSFEELYKMIYSKKDNDILEKIIDAITKSGHYVTLCPPHISQLLGVKALQISNKYVEHMRREYDRRRKYIVPRLNKMGLKTAMPYGAFYAFSNITQSTRSESFD